MPGFNLDYLPNINWQIASSTKVEISWIFQGSRFLDYHKRTKSRIVEKNQFYPRKNSAKETSVAVISSKKTATSQGRVRTPT